MVQFYTDYSLMVPIYPNDMISSAWIPPTTQKHRVARVTHARFTRHLLQPRLSLKARSTIYSFDLHFIYIHSDLIQQTIKYIVHFTINLSSDNS